MHIDKKIYIFSFLFLTVFILGFIYFSMNIEKFTSTGPNKVTSDDKIYVLEGMTNNVSATGTAERLKVLANMSKEQQKILNKTTPEERLKALESLSLINK